MRSPLVDSADILEPGEAKPSVGTGVDPRPGHAPLVDSADILGPGEAKPPVGTGVGPRPGHAPLVDSADILGPGEAKPPVDSADNWIRRTAVDRRDRPPVSRRDAVALAR